MPDGRKNADVAVAGEPAGRDDDPSQTHREGAGAAGEGAGEGEGGAGEGEGEGASVALTAADDDAAVTEFREWLEKQFSSLGEAVKALTPPAVPPAGKRERRPTPRVVRVEAPSETLPDASPAGEPPPPPPTPTRRQRRTRRLTWTR